jgi:N,N-dimethylformamidase beta subunit-like, C-terminal
VLPGGKIDFHVNSRVGPYTIKVYRQGVNEILMASVPVVAEFPGPYPIGPLAWRDGPDWPVAAELTIPPDWPSGLYLARVEQLPLRPQPGPANAALRLEGVPRILGDPLGGSGPQASVDLPFVVRTASRGSQSRILLCIANTTYQAYNWWGGRCLYGFRSRGYRVWSLGTTSQEPFLEQMPRAFRVSLRRPHNPLPDPEFPDVPVKKWQFWEVPLIRWLARRGIAVDLCTETDLHEDSELLANYKLLVSAGHDEYWSKEMRDRVEAFTGAGGNVAFFSGNICWWQIRFEEDNRKMLCYKDRTFDPLNDTQEEHLVTVNWYDTPVQRPETSMTGVSYYGTPAPYPGWVLCQQFVVQDPDHWVLAGTGLETDEFFGQYAGETRTVVGTETDRYQENDPNSPRDFQKVATVFWKGREAANLGTFTRGGTVFTASTMNWLLGLSEDGPGGVIDQITQNVVDRLG